MLLLPKDSNQLLLQWKGPLLLQLKGPYEIAEVVNRIDYKIDVNGMVNMYHANMLNQYV